MRREKSSHSLGKLPAGWFSLPPLRTLSSGGGGAWLLFILMSLILSFSFYPLICNTFPMSTPEHTHETCTWDSGDLEMHTYGDRFTPQWRRRVRLWHCSLFSTGCGFLSTKPNCCCCVFTNNIQQSF